MECSDARILIAGHLDRELDPVHDLEVARHLEGCPSCAGDYQRARSLAARLSDGALRFAAPPALEARIASALARGRGPAAGRGALLSRRGLRLAIPLAAAALLVLALAPRLWRSAGADDLIVNDLVEEHVRSLMASHLTDVASSDRHTVKPWFAGKLDFSPPVDDFAAAGFPLVGGRLDYLGGRAVAALVYRRNRHIINVFVWPGGEAGGAERSAERHGYHVIRFAAVGMSYAVVSDVSAGELEKFAAMLRRPG